MARQEGSLSDCDPTMQFFSRLAPSLLAQWPAMVGKHPANWGDGVSPEHGIGLWAASKQPGGRDSAIQPAGAAFTRPPLTSS